MSKAIFCGHLLSLALRSYVVLAFVPPGATENRFQFSEIHEVQADVRFAARKELIEDSFSVFLARGLTPSFPRR
jgi:hypothetical protein